MQKWKIWDDVHEEHLKESENEWRINANIEFKVHLKYHAIDEVSKDAGEILQ